MVDLCQGQCQTASPEEREREREKIKFSVNDPHLPKSVQGSSLTPAPSLHWGQGRSVHLVWCNPADKWTHSIQCNHKSAPRVMQMLYLLFSLSALFSLLIMLWCAHEPPPSGECSCLGFFFQHIPIRDTQKEKGHGVLSLNVPLPSTPPHPTPPYE